MKQINILLMFLLIMNNFANAKIKKSEVFVLTKEMIKKNKIKEIKLFYLDSTQTFIDTNRFSLFQFDNGNLTFEKNTTWFKNPNIEYCKKKADSNAYHYLYRKNLELRTGGGLKGGGQEQYSKTFTFKNRKLIRSYDLYSKSTSLNGISEPIDVIISYREFYYKLNGKMDYYIDYNEKDTEVSKVYSIYQNNLLIGYYPAKQTEISKVKGDTIYSDERQRELKKIGFKKFSEKYFKGEIKSKVIEDCYEYIKSKQLRINGISINDYLTNFKGKYAKYIIFEVSDNYYLFSKYMTKI